jgi:predicted RNase H-like HicB family nuclease
MPAILRNIVLDEVSLVDRPANPGAEVLLTKAEAPPQGGWIANLWKRAFPADGVTKYVSFDAAYSEGETKERANEMLEEVQECCMALQDSIRSILEDDEISDRGAALDETFAQFQDAIQGLTTEAMEKAFTASAAPDADATAVDTATPVVEETAMNTETKTTEAVSKAEAPALPEDVIRKLAEAEDLRKRVDALEDEREAAIFAKRAADLGLSPNLAHPLRVVRKADPAAADTIEAAFKALTAQVNASSLFGELGTSGATGAATALDELMAKAADIRKAAPALTEAQAFDKASMDYPELMKRHRQEQRAAQRNAI